MQFGYYHIGTPDPGTPAHPIRFVTLSGELDFPHAEAALAPLDDLALSGEAHLVLDTNGVTYLDSTGLAQLVRLNRLYQKSGRCSLVVVSGPYVGRLLRRAGLARWLNLALNEDEARSLLAA